MHKAATNSLRESDRHGRDYLGMCLFIKDQHPDVREWIAHHLAVGASTVYVYDHLSQPPLSELLADHIAGGAVQYTLWNHTFDSGEYGKPPDFFNNPQMHAYETCLRTHGPRHQFLGFLDSDEFLILRKASGAASVPEFLRDMMARQVFGGLAVHWRLFGSSGHLHRPEQGVLQAYTKCMPEADPHNRFVKVLANTDFAIKPHRHNFKYNSSQHAVNEIFVSVYGSTKQPPRMSKIVVHHYQIKSEEEFHQKRERGGGTGLHRSEGFFESIDSNCTETCTYALKFGPYE